jgi:uncharacterized protein YndB with AHSA1/START domain
MKDEISWPGVAGKLELRRTVYIHAPPRKVWEALTEPRLTPKYYYGLRLRTRPRRGGDCSYVGGTGRGDPVIVGRVAQLVPGRKLVATFAFAKLPEDGASRVTFEVHPFGRSTRLAFRHSGFRGRSTTFRWVSGGWDWILSGLKTFVETGRPLRA